MSPRLVSQTIRTTIDNLELHTFYDALWKILGIATEADFESADASFINTRYGRNNKWFERGVVANIGWSATRLAASAGVRRRDGPAATKRAHDRARSSRWHEAQIFLCFTPPE